MGRNAIFLVMGFTLIFVMTGRNLSSMGTTAFLTAINYYENTQGHNIAEVGANIACNQIFLNPSWRAGYSNVSFGGGTFSVTATNVSGTNYVQMVSTATYQGSTSRRSFFCSQADSLNLVFGEVLVPLLLRGKPAIRLRGQCTSMQR